MTAAKSAAMRMTMRAMPAGDEMKLPASSSAVVVVAATVVVVACVVVGAVVVGRAVVVVGGLVVVGGAVVVTGAVVVVVGAGWLETCVVIDAPGWRTAEN
jgi:hypothetical protein